MTDRSDLDAAISHEPDADDASASNPRVRVLIATTEGVVEVEALTREDEALERSVVCLGGFSELSKISERYHAFVANPIGVVERLFGHNAFRLDISSDIDAGRSWQLGVLTAHALESAGRLAERLSADAPDPAGALVLATGEVRSRRLEVDPVDHVARKLDRALPQLKAAVADGQRVIVATPAGSADQISAEMRSELAALRIELFELSEAGPLLATLDIKLDAPAADAVGLQPRQRPFPGDAPFERADRDVFFGRNAARRLQLERLREAAASGCAFLLLTGASGVGKTSLLRAGLVDDLIDSVGDAAGWRVALSTATPRDAIASIAAPIAEACPEIVDVATLELGILTDAVAMAEELLARFDAFDRPLRLFIGVDQLECALLARPPAPEAVGAFLERLTAAPGARVWAAATLRSSGISDLARSPALARMAGSGRSLRVAGLDRFEMKEAIEQPVRVAGLTIRGSHERPGGLVDRLVDEAARGQHGGGLLAKMLSELYEQDGAARELSAATLERMGGLDGAVRRWADASAAAIRRRPDTSAALERVILALAKFDLETGRPMPRRADADALRARAADARALDALVDARLVALDRDDGAGQAIAVASTPALLTEWSTAREILARRSDALALRDELELGARFWRRHGDDESILIGEGEGLENAAALLRAGQTQLDRDAQAYVRESLAARDRRALRSERRGLMAAAAAVGLALIVALGLRTLVDAWAGRYETRAETLAGAAIELADEGRPQIAALLAVAAAPEPSREALAAALHRPSPTVERALYTAWSGVVEIDRPPPPPPLAAATETMLDAPAATGGAPGGVARFSPDETKLLVASGHRAIVYDWPRNGPGRVLESAHATSSPIVDALFSPDGAYVITRHADGRILRWLLEESVFLGDLTAAAPPLGGDPGRFAGGDLFFRPNGDLISLAPGGAMTIWTPAVGVRGPMETSSPRVGPSGLSSDGMRLVTLHEDGARVWDLEDAASEAPLTAVRLAVGVVATRAAFAPDTGELFLLGTQVDGEPLVRILDSAEDRTPIDLPGYGAPLDLGFEVDAAGGAAFWALWDTATVQRAARGPGEPWTERDASELKGPHQADCPPRFMPTGPVVLQPSCDAAGVRALGVSEAGAFTSIRRRDFAREPLLALRLSPRGSYVHGFDDEGRLRVYTLGGVGASADPEDDAGAGVRIAAHRGAGLLTETVADRAIWGARLRDRTVAADAPTDLDVVDFWAVDYRVRADGGTAAAVLAATPDGDMAASAIPGGPIRLWRPGRRRSLAWITPGGTPRELRFAQGADGLSALMVAALDRGVRAWSIEALIAATPDARAPAWAIEAVDPILAPSPSAGVIAVGERTGGLRLLDAATGEDIWHLEVDGGVDALAIDRDGRMIYVAGVDCRIAAYDAATGARMGSLAPRLPAHRCRAGVERLTALPDGRVAAGMSGRVAIFAPTRRDGSAWRVDAETARATGYRVVGVAIDEDGAARAAVQGTERPSLLMWTHRFTGMDRADAAEIDLGSDGARAVFDPRRLRTATLDRDGSVTIYNRDGVRIGRAPNLGRGWSAAAFAPTGHWLATLDQAGGVRFWPLDDDLGRLAARIDVELTTCRSASQATELGHAVRLALGPLADWVCADGDG